MDKILDEYFALQDAIFNNVGYVEDWVTIPLVDHREYYWHLDQNTDGSGEIMYYDMPLTNDLVDKGEYYSAVIYMQRFLPKWVYRGKSHTLVCMDTQTDGNKYLGMFCNKKECNDVE